MWYGEPKDDPIRKPAGSHILFGFRDKMLFNRLREWKGIRGGEWRGIGDGVPGQSSMNQLLQVQPPGRSRYTSAVLWEEGTFSSWYRRMRPSRWRGDGWHNNAKHAMRWPIYLPASASRQHMGAVA